MDGLRFAPSFLIQGSCIQHEKSRCADDGGYYYEIYHLASNSIWFNTEKPHRSLNKKPPLRYYIDSLHANNKKSNMLWTLTFG